MRQPRGQASQSKIMVLELTRKPALVVQHTGIPSGVACLQVEDETSSANNAFSGMGTPSVSQLESPAEVPQMSTGMAGHPSLATAGSMPESEAYGEEEANKKDTAAADDLRELAAKGVCAPLWRTNQPVQPVSRPCMPTLARTG